MIEEHSSQPMQATTPMARFGKYEVVGLLGRGGMAEVFLCRLGGLGGFNKEVVVKRILPHHLGDPGFLQMFIEEARLAANLNHPNVVQVFEIDEANGIPYMAMEYVRGPTLATVISEARSKGSVHLGHFAKILSGVCAGLHHAHTACGPDGERLGIIHRDVSPQNILISPDGVPKILDFGIAKAHGRSVATEAGTLKGKLRYMAPERLQHEEVDARADVFSAGVVLFEATTGRVPFGAPGSSSEFDLISNLLSGKCARPSQVVPDYPEELEKLVLWSMAHRAADRCPSAHHLHQALEAFVSQGDHVSSTHELAQWMHALVPSRLFSTPTGEAARRARAGLANNVSTPQEVLGISGRIPHLDASNDTVATASHPGLAAAQAIAAVPASSRKRKIGAVVAMVAACAALALWSTRKVEPVTTTASAPAALTPEMQETAFSPDEAARAYLDEVDRLIEGRRYGLAEQLLAKARELKIVDPALTIRLVRADDGLRVQLALREARDFLAQKQYGSAIEAAKNVLDRDPENAEAIQLIATSRAARDPVDTSARASRSPRRERAGSLQVLSNVPGMVYLNDEPLGRTPIRDKEVPAGEYTLQIRAQGHQPYETRIRVASGKPFNVEATLASEATAQRESEPQAAPPAAEAVPPALSTAPTWRPVSAPTAESAAAKVARVGTATPEQPRELTTSAGAAVGTSAPAPVAAAPAPSKSGTDKTVSARPNDRIPSPTLPRQYDAKDAADLQRACRIIEKQVMVLAGVSPDFANGVTTPLQRVIGEGGGRLYPVAMYYLIVIEAGRGHDKKTAGQALVGMHGDSGLRERMGALPARPAKH
jgi:serine/threonine protein kinase